LLAASYPFLDVFWTLMVFFLWVLWLWILFTVFADIFRRHDLSGWGKAGWIIFTIVLPYLGVFIYLITQSKGMTERNLEQARAQRVQFDDYVRRYLIAKYGHDRVYRGGLRIPINKNFGVRLDLRVFGTVLDSESDIFCVSSGGLTCRIKAKGDFFVQYSANLGVTYGF